MNTSCGPLVMIGFPDRKLTGEYKDLILENDVRGVILFKRNIEGPDQLGRLCEEIHALGSLQSPPTYIFIAIDQEGGLVNRLGDIVIPVASAMSFGRINDPQIHFKIILSLSQRLKDLGIGTHFPPVVDLYHPLNPQLVTRAYSDNPEQVTAFAQVFIQASREAGIIPCIKHFPGLGPCMLDTHHQAGIITKGKAEFYAEDLVPFRELVSNGPLLVMVSHAEYPHLTVGESGPASLSSSIIHDLLRTELGYDGVCVSDDMEMKAISERYALGDAAILSIMAGADVVLVCHDIVRQREVMSALREAVSLGEILPQRINQSLNRVHRLSELLQQWRIKREKPFVDIHDIEERTQRVYRRAVEIIRDPQSLLPIDPVLFPSISLGLVSPQPFLSNSGRKIKFLLSQAGQQMHIKDVYDLSVQVEPLLSVSPQSLMILIGSQWENFLNKLPAAWPVSRPWTPIFVLSGDPAEAQFLPENATCLSLLNYERHSLERAFEIIFGSDDMKEIVRFT